MDPSNSLQSPEIEVVENGKTIELFRPDIFRWDLNQAGYGEGKWGFCFP